MTGFFRTLILVPLVGLSLPSEAQNHEQEIHRALIQRDQQAAEFAAAARGDAASLEQLRALHERQRRELAQPLSSDPGLARELLPYQRQRMADERALVFAPPVMRSGPDPDLGKALPLPGGPRSGVDPVLPQGLPY